MNMFNQPKTGTSTVNALNAETVQAESFTDLHDAVAQLSNLVGSSLTQIYVLEGKLFGFESNLDDIRKEPVTIFDKTLVTIREAEELYRNLIRLNQKVQAD